MISDSIHRLASDSESSREGVAFTRQADRFLGQVDPERPTDWSDSVPFVSALPEVSHDRT